MTASKLRPAFAALVLLCAGAAQAVSLTGGGFTETFDSMGSSGTSNSTWTTTIPGNGTNSVATMVAGTTNNNGFNAANLAPAPATDRVLATSPTTVSGGALQLRLSNDTGAALPGINIGYDTVRYRVTTTANELPGYWLFYSLDGSSWSHVAGLTPTPTTVPNTLGVSPFGGSFYFTTPVASNANFFLRWVDDNADQTAPDQIIGLNNLSVSAVPEPGAATFLLAGLGVLLFMARRQRQEN